MLAKTLTRRLTATPQSRFHRIRRAAALLLIGWAALLGAGAANAQTLSSDATLFALQILNAGDTNVALTPGFHKNTVSYDATTPAGDTHATVAAITNDPDATIEYLDFSDRALTDQSTTDDHFQVNLFVGDNIVKVKVTAEDTTTTKTYTVTIRRPSTEASLSTLLVYNEATGTALTFTPSFSGSITSYAATTGPSVSQIRIQAFKAHADATIEYLDNSDNTLTDQSTTNTGFQHNLSVGDNTVKMKVTAEDGVTTKTYTLTILRQSDNANLSALTLTDPANNAVTLTPSFAAATTIYTASVAETVDTVTLGFTTQNDQANVDDLDGNDDPLTDADTMTTGVQVALDVGENIIKFKVTAGDSSTTKTYTVTVTRRDETAPMLTSAVITSPHTWLRLIYDESLDSTSIPNKSAFEVKVQNAVRSVSATGNPSSNVIVLTLSSAPRPGETITVSYTVPSMNPIQDAAGNEATGLTDEAVANDIPAKAPERPPNLTATPRGTDSMDLAWTTPWANGSDITSYDVRYTMGTTIGGTWTEIEDSDATTTSHTITGLTAGDTYTFQIRAVNGEGNGSGARVTKTVAAPTWEFTLKRAGNHITQLTEGGANAIAAVRITNSVRFTSDQTITLKWGDDEITSGLIQGGDGAEATFDIPNGTASGAMTISAPDRAGDLYHPAETRTLTANWGGSQIGDGIELEYVDDEAKPVATLVLSPSFQRSDGVSRLTVVEGDFLLPFATLSRGYDLLTHPGMKIEVTDSANKFVALAFETVDGKTLLGIPFATASATQSLESSLTTVDNSTAGDHSEHVFAIVPNPDYFTIGTPSSATLTILDNDAAPTAPQNLTAGPGNAEVTLEWGRPTSYATTELTGYELKVTPAVGSFGSFDAIPDSDADTTSYTVTGLTNNTAYTFEVRGTNSAGGGTPASIMATPTEHGVSISRTSIEEGENTTLTIIPEGAPFDSLKTITLVLASESGLDRPGRGSDFTVFEDVDRIFGGPRAFNAGGFSGRQPHFQAYMTPDEVSVTLTVNAVDDELSECREDMHAFTYVDYGNANQMQIGPSQRIAIFDDDNQPKLNGVDRATDIPTLESATVDGRTVMLTFNGDLTEASPGDDPLLEDGEVPLRAPMFFTLFEAVGPGVAGPNDGNRGNANFYTHPYGTGARTFALDGRTVTFTFPHRVDTSHMAWIRYDQYSRYSPLGMTLPEPTPGRCVLPVGVDSFTSNIPMGANTADDDPLPVITITQNAEVTEGEGPMEFTVTLTPASTELVTVDFRTIARSAQSAMRDTSGNVHGDFWPIAGTLQFQPGERTKTVSVQIVDDSVEDDGEHFLLDLSDASGATMNDLTSYGTGTIRNSEDVPTGNENTLTASFANVPAEHGGPGETNRFTFDLSFSENPEVSYRTLRDNHAFTVTGGDVKKAKRKVQGSNQSWTITVEPDGWGDVRLTLPGNRACSASNAVCTSDGRQLANSPSATISGPAALSIADATANENSDSGLNFVVSLDRVSTLTVTVNYATSDGTATAGHDYTATSGTLTFNPGDAAKSINVALLDDAIDDGGETMTVTLSNASNARIADGTATGTIENSDPLQQAWIARFGRTVAADVVDGITERLESRGAHSEVRIAGRTLQHNGGTWTEAPVEDAELVDPLEGTQPFETDQVMSAQELMLNSSFRLQGAMDETGGAAWGAWGRFSASSFEGEADGVTLSGDVVTGLLGADVGTDTWTAGIALSAAKGDGPFQLVDDGADSANGPCDRGTVESTLTSIHPYAELSITNAVDVWAIGGYGTGDMTIDHTACEVFKTDIDMMMAAAGVRGQVLSTDAGDALDSTVRTDMLWLRASSDRTERMLAAEADVTRLRLMVDAGRAFTAGAGTLTPTVEAGLRHDAGDAEEGVGFEIGAGLAYQGTGISIEGKVRTLVAHDDSAYEEWGASFAVRIDPGSDGHGLSLSITPTWGSAASEAEQLWSTRTAEDLVSDNTFEADRRIDAELGYGVGGPYGWGTLTPFGGLTLSDGGQRTLRTGLRWNASESATLALEGTREENGDGVTPANALMLRAQVRF